jgi:hypothetical protein
MEETKLALAEILNAPVPRIMQCDRQSVDRAVEMRAKVQQLNKVPEANGG